MRLMNLTGQSNWVVALHGAGVRGTHLARKIHRHRPGTAIIVEVNVSRAQKLEQEGFSVFFENDEDIYGPLPIHVFSLPVPLIHTGSSFQHDLSVLKNALTLFAIQVLKTQKDWKLCVLCADIAQNTMETELIPQLTRSSGKSLNRDFGVVLMRPEPDWNQKICPIMRYATSDEVSAEKFMDLFGRMGPTFRHRSFSSLECNLSARPVESFCRVSQAVS